MMMIVNGRGSNRTEAPATWLTTCSTKDVDLVSRELKEWNRKWKLVHAMIAWGLNRDDHSRDPFLHSLPSRGQLWAWGKT